MMPKRYGSVLAGRGSIIGPLGFLVVLVTAILSAAAQVTSGPSQPTGPVAAPQAAASPSQEISGRVIGPDGRPVAGAQVTLAEQFCPVMLHNAILEKETAIPEGAREEQLVETDGQGRFRFEGQWSHPFYLFAAHPAGFAAVAGKVFEVNREVRLERWGRIEGQVAKGRGGADHRVWMAGLPRPALAGRPCHVRYDTPCDANERFVFEKVPPGWFNVGYLIALGDDFEGFTMRTAVVVRAGETAKVKLGGEGRPVIGRFVPPASYGRPIKFVAGLRALHRDEGIERDKDKEDQMWRQLSADDPYANDMYVRDPRTEVYVIATEASQRRWYHPWFGWDDEAWLLGNGIWSDIDWRGYTFRINPDGSFRVEDVVPGHYDLRVVLQENEACDEFPWRFAQYRAKIQVPPIAGPHADRPFDMGTLTLDMLGVGEPAPLFEAETIDGKPVRLVDYRGQFVLLSFAGPENREPLACLKELSKTYRTRGDFRIIERYIGSAEAAQQYGAEYQIEWPVICGGATFPDAFARKYHLDGYPTAVLVDPEGNVVATNLERERLMKTVRDTLADVPARAPISSGARQ